MTRSGSSPRRIVLIGAARSGTKILRDTLAAATGAGAVPFDIGFVWSIGTDEPHDVLEPGLLRPREREFIARYVDGYAAGSPSSVIEKTVGNTLRVPYVADVFPDATFVHLVRNGVDVAESTWRQWREPADYRYLVRKLGHFPARMLPTYGRAHAASLLRRRISGDGRVSSWGPRYPGIDADLGAGDLLTVCARQWRESVARATRDLAAVDAPVVEVRYEELVARPRDILARVADFCGLSAVDADLARAADRLSPSRQGHGTRSLDRAQLATLEAEIGDVMEGLGYPRPRDRDVEDER